MAFFTNELSLSMYEEDIVPIFEDKDERNISSLEHIGKECAGCILNDLCDDTSANWEDSVLFSKDLPINNSPYYDDEEKNNFSMGNILNQLNDIDNDMSNNSPFMGQDANLNDSLVLDQDAIFDNSPNTDEDDDNSSSDVNESSTSRAASSDDEYPVLEEYKPRPAPKRISRKKGNLEKNQRSRVLVKGKHKTAMEEYKPKPAPKRISRKKGNLEKNQRSRVLVKGEKLSRKESERVRRKQLNSCYDAAEKVLNHRSKLSHKAIIDGLCSEIRKQKAILYDWQEEEAKQLEIQRKEQADTMGKTKDADKKWATEDEWGNYE